MSEMIILRYNTYFLMVYSDYNTIHYNKGYLILLFPVSGARSWPYRKGCQDVVLFLPGYQTPVTLQHHVVCTSWHFLRYFGPASWKHKGKFNKQVREKAPQIQPKKLGGGVMPPHRSSKVHAFGARCPIVPTFILGEYIIVSSNMCIYNYV